MGAMGITDDPTNVNGVDPRGAIVTVMGMWDRMWTQGGCNGKQRGSNRHHWVSSGRTSWTQWIWLGNQWILFRNLCGTGWGD